MSGSPNLKSDKSRNSLTSTFNEYKDKVQSFLSVNSKVALAHDSLKEGVTVISESRDLISVSELGRLQMKEALVKRNLEELSARAKWKRNSDQRSVQLANEAVEAATDYLHDAQHTCRTAQGVTPATLSAFRPPSSPGASSSTPLPSSGSPDSVRTIRRKSAIRFSPGKHHLLDYAQGATSSGDEEDQSAPPPLPPKSATQRVRALVATNTPMTTSSRLLESHFSFDDMEKDEYSPSENSYASTIRSSAVHIHQSTQHSVHVQRPPLLDRISSTSASVITPPSIRSKGKHTRRTSQDPALPATQAVSVPNPRPRRYSAPVPPSPIDANVTSSHHSPSPSEGTVDFENLTAAQQKVMENWKRRVERSDTIESIKSADSMLVNGSRTPIEKRFYDLKDGPRRSDTAESEITYCSAHVESVSEHW